MVPLYIGSNKSFIRCLKRWVPFFVQSICIKSIRSLCNCPIIILSLYTLTYLIFWSQRKFKYANIWQLGIWPSISVILYSIPNFIHLKHRICLPQFMGILINNHGKKKTLVFVIYFPHMIFFCIDYNLTSVLPYFQTFYSL